MPKVSETCWSRVRRPSVRRPNFRTQEFSEVDLVDVVSPRFCAKSTQKKTLSRSNTTPGALPCIQYDELQTRPMFIELRRRFCGCTSHRTYEDLPCELDVLAVVILDVGEIPWRCVRSTQCFFLSRFGTKTRGNDINQLDFRKFLRPEIRTADRRTPNPTLTRFTDLQQNPYLKRNQLTSIDFP